jgi:hypothetical protein
LTGLEAVEARDAFEKALTTAADGKRTAYLPLRPEVLGGATPSALVR